MPTVSDDFNEPHDIGEDELAWPASDRPDRLAWLHGWPWRGGLDVEMGSGVHCIGCGRMLGVFTVVLPENWQRPGSQPDWPFPEDRCPVCLCRDAYNEKLSGETWPRGQSRGLP